MRANKPASAGAVLAASEMMRADGLLALAVVVLATLEESGQVGVGEDPDQPIGWQTPSVDPVHIGSGSWLGANAVVLPGTWLGNNNVVAAGAVVRGRFDDHVVLGGVPAKVLRHWTKEGGWQSGPKAEA